jgi:DNA-binding IclR family transcriptional regulator
MPPPESWFVTRTMRALEVLAFEPLSAPQLATELQIHPRTARRLLTRLTEEGYVTRSDDVRRRYRPTMRIVALAGQIVEHAELTRTAARFVDRLHERSGGVAHLMVPSYRDVLCLVHRANTDRPARPQLGELVPTHCTAPGKALLAHRDAWRESVLGAPLEAHTARTITDPNALRAEVAIIRERGYAIEDCEHHDGERAVAAPVFSSGEAVAALTATAPPARALDELGPVVAAMARALSAELGSGHG